MSRFQTTKEYLGYQNGQEITSLDPRYLVSGSKNVLIDTGRRSYTSRPGIEILGAVATGTLGIKGHFKWQTSTKQFFLLRAYDRFLEVWFNDVWTRILTTLSSPYAEFATVYNNTEKQDICCFVNGEEKIQNWTGGAALAVAQASGGTTLKMRGAYTAGTIAFVDGGASPDTITDSANGFVTAGFAAGNVISVSGTTNNNRSFTVATVTAGTITLVPNDVATTEAAGASVTIHNGFATWKSRGFVTTGTRKVIIAGTEYAYTGGEATDTLTGLSGLPAITAGQVILQAVRSNNNASPVPSGYTNDYIGSQRNQIWIGSKTSRLVFASKTSSFTDFTYTANRLPGEGVELHLDTFAQGFESTKEEISIFGGEDDIYSVIFQLSTDNTKEAVNITKKDTSQGQGLIAPRAKTKIKNGIAFITREPTLDTLGNVENFPSEANIPVSDLIKADFDVYDFTDSEMVYWKRNLIISLPAETKVLLYDLRYAIWQPPQEFAIAIGGLDVNNEGNLVGHSYTTDESYTLFSANVLGDEVGEEISGNFDGFSIEAAARHYSNGGIAHEQKRFDRYYVEGYISSGASVEHRLEYEVAGSGGTGTGTINALTDRFLFGVSDVNTLGKNALGSYPLGGGGIGSAAGLLRFRKMLTYPEKPHYEYFSKFYQNSALEQFTITIHGPNSSPTEEQDTNIMD